MTSAVLEAGNLPAQLTSFVNRKAELVEAKRLLGIARVVTLTGIGGVGKTRLSLRIGGDVQRAYPDGVWFVGLGDIQSPEMVASTIISTLGVTLQPGSDALQSLVDALRNRRSLLIINNCEHLVETAANTIRQLITGCPDLTVLATSRELLDIQGEVALRVPALSTPQPNGSEPYKGVEHDAVALFADRASMGGRPFEVTDRNRQTLGEICYRLDGLPLAIELAAARLQVLSPTQILDRLSDSYRLLVGGSRTAPERQRTLRSSLVWSYELCTPSEQLLWARLSVFWGGFELDAVEGICGGDGLGTDDVMDLVQSLVSKSILIRDHNRGSAARYRMLETIRSFGLEHLAETTTTIDLRRRHKDWFVQLLRRAESDFISVRQLDWLARLEAEVPNIQAALDYCLAHSDQIEDSLELSVPMAQIHWAQGRASTVQLWLQRSLAATVKPTSRRAQGLFAQSYLAISDGAVDNGSWIDVSEAHRIAESVGDPDVLAAASMDRVLAALVRADPGPALAAYRSGLSALPENTLPIRRLALMNFGAYICVMTGQLAEAEAIYEAIESLAEPVQERFFRSFAIRTIALVAWQRGELERASELAAESLRMKRDLREPIGIALGMQAMAYIAVSNRQFKQGATLLGVADGLWRSANTQDWEPIEIGYRDSCELQARARLGDSAYAAASDAGSAMSYSAAFEFALGEPGTSAVPVKTTTNLTARERQIAALLAQGLTNRQIAATIVISQRTAEGHVERVMAKLGLSSRAQVAVWAAQNPEALQPPN